MKKFFTNPWRLLALALVALVATAGACESGNTSTLNNDRDAANEQLQRYQRTQPVPSYDWSQLRQNVIDITTFQVEGTQSTAFFFNLGADDPFASCPSIGDPIPTTAQLTNPLQLTRQESADDPALPQIEQTGVYTGESTATNVMCIDAQGDPYKAYWEGFVYSVSAPAVWDYENHRIELVGPSSFGFSGGQ